MRLLDLAGKRGLVVGIAKPNSIAYGCARAFHAAGAELAIEYLNAKAEPYVRPGIVLGARVPIILTSRADTVLARMASCAVGLVAARRGALPRP